MSETASFWDRRRAAVAAEAEAEQAALDAAKLADSQAELEAQTDEEILAQLELPEPETLKAGDDFTAFLSDIVPDRIRRRALRVLWRSNPVLANVDQLVDYGEDFTDSATVVENLQTTYQVGKGMLKHVEELARQAAEAEAADPVEELEEPAPEPGVETAEAEPEVTSPREETDELTGVAEVADHATSTPRRMKFVVEETA